MAYPGLLHYISPASFRRVFEGIVLAVVNGLTAHVVRAIFISDMDNQELVESITMPNHLSSKVLISSLRRVPAVFAIIAFAMCQIACLSHFHCLELSHLDHHHHVSSGCDDDHGDKYEHSGCEDEECTFTDIHDHSGFDYTIAPSRLEFCWPEISIDCVEAPISMGSSRAAEHSSTGCARSPLDRHGFTFIGRSPTAS